MGYGRRRPADPVVDHFGTPILVGDRYFATHPERVGTVIKVLPGGITIQYGVEHRDGWVCQTTHRKSPEQGVCLDKIPSGDGLGSF